MKSIFFMMEANNRSYSNSMFNDSIMETFMHRDKMSNCNLYFYTINIEL